MTEIIPARIARLEANYYNVAKQVEDHEKRDEDRFERTFSFVKGMKAEILDALDTTDKKINVLDSKVDTLWDEKNERKGAIKMSKFIGHGISGLVGGTIALIVELVKK
jgi:hypothetical protein